MIPIEELGVVLITDFREGDEELLIKEHFFFILRSFYTNKLADTVRIALATCRALINPINTYLYFLEPLTIRRGNFCVVYAGMIKLIVTLYYVTGLTKKQAEYNFSQ